jgi:uncharacterized membrane protein
MPEPKDKIAELQAQLDRLVRTQIDFQREVTRIREELGGLRKAASVPSDTVNEASFASGKVDEKVESPPQHAGPAREWPPQDQTQRQPPEPSYGYSERTRSRVNEKVDAVKASAKSDIEKFIGENLLSKIGIVILVIGVAIGGKYAIDNGWVSPLMRIVFGYVCGLALIGIAVRLKPRYLNFSAVLISGGMAIMYFITYFAYAFYGLITQPAAFVLMVLFTAFAVIAAMIYSKQVIAHIGLVGGYATPFLLSTGSANYPFLFTYIAIINLGILAISLKKYWKPVFFTSFIFTWTIFAVWFGDRFEADRHFALALGFLTVYFLIFYCSFIGYKLFYEKNLEAENIIVILLNSAIFFGLGCAILTRPDGDTTYLGTFAVINAAIHLGFAFIADGIRKVPSDIVYLCAALCLLFLTLAIPLQFDGNVVTLFWSAEAFALFLIGRKKGIVLFEIASYPAAFLASVSLLALWANNYSLAVHGTVFPTFLNSAFVSGIFYVIAMSAIAVIDRDGKEPPLDESLAVLMRYAIRFAAAAALYNVFRMEIEFYFRNKAIEMRPPGSGEYFSVFNDLEYLSAIWQINYSLVFFALLGYIDIKRWRDRLISWAIVACLLLAVFIFCTVGLLSLSELYRAYSGDLTILLPLRYISLACLSTAVYVVYRYLSGDRIFSENIKLKELLFDGFFYTLLWIILSNELVTWMTIFGVKDSFKLGLSILWGIYALVLVIIGIARAKKHLRIGAIGLFAITLIKMFFYDIAYMDTISKTAVFVSLGVLILLVAFLYNKYASLIFSAKEDEEEV